MSRTPAFSRQLDRTFAAVEGQVAFLRSRIDAFRQGESENTLTKVEMRARIDHLKKDTEKVMRNLPSCMD
jgi:hypothetical protein